jgi:hypothetical protein
VIALVLALPAGAQAATVRFWPEDDLTLTDAYFEVRDSAGENNDLAIAAGRRLVVVERGNAPLKAGHGCRRRNKRTVVCAGRVDVEVYAGGGDDSVSIRCPRTRLMNVAGGRGADRIHTRGACPAGMQGGPGEDVLQGGLGEQYAAGGAGSDRLAGGAGADLLWGDGTGGRGNDVIDGGRGRDTVLYDERSAGVRVDLQRGVGGRGHERDRLWRIEDAVGSGAGDVLLGDAHQNRLWGVNGADRLFGRGGHDLLDGGGLFNRSFPVDDGKRDRFGCGSGDDIVVFPARAVLPVDCESMQDYTPLNERTVPIRPRPRDGHRVAVPVVCDPYAKSCRRSVRVRAGGKLLGHTGPVTVRAGLSWVVVRLRGRPRLDGSLTIRVGGKDEQPDGGPIPYRFAWRLGCAGAPPGDACRAGG